MSRLFRTENKGFCANEPGQRATPAIRSWQRQRNSLIQNKFERERARHTHTHAEQSMCMCAFVYFIFITDLELLCNVIELLDYCRRYLRGLSFVFRFPLPPIFSPSSLLAYLHADCIRRIDAIMSPLELGIEIGIWMW